MAWLVIGQMVGWVLYSTPVQDRLVSEWFRVSMALAYSIGAVGGFVVVAQMMMSDEVCTVI